MKESTKSSKLYKAYLESGNIDVLIEILAINTNKFYNGEETEIADDEFDRMEKLVQSQRPGFHHRDLLDMNKFTGEELPHMIEYRPYTKTNDIANFDSIDAFNEYMSKYIILPKFDGSSCIQYNYPDGRLKVILSRHDDVTGRVQTSKLQNKFMDAILNRYRVSDNSKVPIAILAECVVNQQNGGRSKANGLVNSKYLQDEVDNYANLMIFDTVMSDGTRYPNLYYEITDYKVFSELRDTGYLTTPFGKIPCDGIVGYARDGSECIDIHKFYYNESEIVKIDHIDWDISWNSLIYHPVGVIKDPVLLEGTYVQRASLYNYKYIVDNGCFPGATVRLAKANVTIPKFVEVISPIHKENPDKYYDKSTEVTDVSCPFCGHRMVKFGNTDLVCGNIECDAVTQTIIARLLQGSNVSNEVIDEMWSLGLTKLSELVEYLHRFPVDLSWTKWETLDVKKFFMLLGIPRFSSAKIDNIASDWESVNKTKSTFEVILNNYFSDLNWEYYDYIIPKIENVLSII